MKIAFRMFHKLTDYNGYLWALGGFVVAWVHTNTEFYAKDTDTWMSGPDLPGPLHGFCVVKVTVTTTLLVGKLI